MVKLPIIDTEKVDKTYKRKCWKYQQMEPFTTCGGFIKNGKGIGKKHMENVEVIKFFYES